MNKFTEEINRICKCISRYQKKNIYMFIYIVEMVIKLMQM